MTNEFLTPEEEPHEIHRVPGEWRCLQCSARLSTEPTLERPPCPNGCEKLMVPMTWKRYGPEQQALLAVAQETIRQGEEQAQNAIVRADRTDTMLTKLRDDHEALHNRMRSCVLQALVLGGLIGSALTLLIGRL